MSSHSSSNSSSFDSIITDRYSLVKLLGEGGYGAVYLAEEKATKQLYAIKCCKPCEGELLKDGSNNGISQTTGREFTILNQLRSCPQIVQVHEIIVSKSKETYIVMEYLPMDLDKFLKMKEERKQKLRTDEVIRIFKQLVEGVKYMHDKQIMHRDIKPRNILINPERMIVKIADFGLARHFSYISNENHSNEVQTVNYRPPEILMGSRNYSYTIDIWPLGAILYELLCLQKMISPKGKIYPHEVTVLFEIFSLFGTPTDQEYPEMKNLPGALKNPPRFKPTNFNDPKYFFLGNLGKQLFLSICKINPSKRPSAAQILEHPFFKDEHKLRVIPSINMQDKGNDGNNGGGNGPIYQGGFSSIFGSFANKYSK